jgi:hypothetical protein
MPDLAQDLQQIAHTFPPHAEPFAGRIANHPIWPHPRAEMTDETAIRLRLAADILVAGAVAGYIDADHARAAGWTPQQIEKYFVATVNALAAEGRLPRFESPTE